jgi:hypothetical protein
MTSQKWFTARMIDRELLDAGFIVIAFEIALVAAAYVAGAVLGRPSPGDAVAVAIPPHPGPDPWPPQQ